MGVTYENFHPEKTIVDRGVADKIYIKYINYIYRPKMLPFYALAFGHCCKTWYFGSLSQPKPNLR